MKKITKVTTAIIMAGSMAIAAGIQGCSKSGTNSVNTSANEAAVNGAVSMANVVKAEDAAAENTETAKLDFIEETESEVQTKAETVAYTAVVPAYNDSTDAAKIYVFPKPVTDHSERKVAKASKTENKASETFTATPTDVNSKQKDTAGTKDNGDSNKSDNQIAGRPLTTPKTVSAPASYSVPASSVASETVEVVKAETTDSDLQIAGRPLTTPKTVSAPSSYSVPASSVASETVEIAKAETTDSDLQIAGRPLTTPKTVSAPADYSVPASSVASETVVQRKEIGTAIAAPVKTTETKPTAVPSYNPEDTQIAGRPLTPTKTVSAPADYSVPAAEVRTVSAPADEVIEITIEPVTGDDKGTPDVKPEHKHHRHHGTDNADMKKGHRHHHHHDGKKPDMKAGHERHHHHDVNGRHEHKEHKGNHEHHQHPDCHEHHNKAPRD